MSDCELPQYYFCKERVARKEHKCCECSAPINVGEKHLVVSACWEGRPDRYRQHILCEKACEYVRDKGLNDDECIYYGGLQEWYHDWIKSAWWEGEKEDHSAMWRFMLAIRRRERKSRLKVSA